MLSINASAVRDRALAALTALGPQTSVSRESQARITDYLLGQLSDQEADQVRDLLADSPSERAWARVLSSELAPLSSGPLPEIPVERSSPRAEAPPAPEPVTGPRSDEPATAGTPPSAVAPIPELAKETQREPQEPAGPRPAGRPRSSRRGGMVVIGTAVVVVAVVLVVVLSGGGSGGKHHAASTPTTSSTTVASQTSSSTTTSSTSSAAAKVLAQINLSPPSTSAGSKTAGIAEILSEGTTNGVAIVAQNVPPNTTKPPNAYAVWLYNSPTDASILGFVNPGVTKTGRLSTAGPLPSNAAHFKQLIVTLETSAKPKTPGQIVLEGTITGL